MGSLWLHDWVTLSVGKGPDGLEAFDLGAVGGRCGAWHPLTPSRVPRPCAHAAQVPAVQVVRERGGAPVSVHRQSAGHSSCDAELCTRAVRTVQKYVVVPQVQVLGKAVDAPVVVRRLVPWSPKCALACGRIAVGWDCAFALRGVVLVFIVECVLIFALLAAGRARLRGDTAVQIRRCGHGLPSGWSGHFAAEMRHFSDSAHSDVESQGGALDGRQLLVVEGSGWRGCRESDSQVFCHP